MSIGQNMDAVFAEYRRHPEFLGMNVHDTNTEGALGATLLHIVARKGDRNAVLLLVNAGARLDAAGDLKNTPLHEAAMAGKTEIVKLLIGLGANPTLRNEFDETPLDIAINGNRSEVADFLKAL
jgi:ankyrin repeat protein